MSDSDLERLVEGDDDGLTRAMLEGALGDAPHREAKAGMLAALERRASGAAARGAPPPRALRWGSNYIHGLLLVIAGGAVATTFDALPDQGKSTSERNERGVVNLSPVSTGAQQDTAPASPAGGQIGPRTPPRENREQAPLEQTPLEQAPLPPSSSVVSVPSGPVARPRGAAPAASVTARTHALSADRSSRAPLATPPPPASVSAASTLGRESARVRAARSALTDGDPSLTLRLLDAYASEFPGGVFTLEVSVLRVEALARTGRIDDARQLAETFLSEHPRGAFADRVRAAVRGGPLGNAPLGNGPERGDAPSSRPQRVE